jgi:hypothetical protein
MVNLSGWQKQELAKYRDRLNRVERGEVWGSDHPGPCTADERAVEITRIKSLISELEAGRG